ncbi:class I SAM-dependent methyltransferase [Trujillonella humicola]|uniref:class I SAM-dependent methyltransferase n=1 Tax=Trujillonella humicola TaxID=3383699 RepID=UPI0039063819
MSATLHRQIDPARTEAFAGRLLATYTDGVVTLLIDLGHRTGLLETLAAGEGTGQELAERAGLAERYVRECLGGLVTAGIVEYSPATATYRLPPEHAVCLSGPGSLNLAPLSRISALLGRHVGDVAEAFRSGGGVPYSAFRPEFTDVMDEVSRGLLDGQLLEGIVPLVDGLGERLAAGARVADVGCGTGHAVNLLARAHPRAAVTGYDLAADAIGRARAEAADWGLPNARFEVRDATDLPTDPPFTAVFAFDAIHDQADPAGVLRRIHDALEPGGVFVMLDIKAASALEDNVGNPLAPWLYGVSTLHCLTVSLAVGGAGLGTVWGEEQARRMLAEAGFVDVSVRDVPDDPLDSLYVAHRPAGRFAPDGDRR